MRNLPYLSQDFKRNMVKESETLRNFTENNDFLKKRGVQYKLQFGNDDFRATSI